MSDFRLTIYDLVILTYTAKGRSKKAKRLPEQNSSFVIRNS